MGMPKSWADAYKVIYANSGPMCGKPGCGSTFTDAALRGTRIWVGIGRWKVPTPIKGQVTEVHCHICNTVSIA
jgi:hypothetical protein